jgi:A/G-specific adenine glycosylase
MVEGFSSAAAARAALASLGLTPSGLQDVGRVTHVLTHRRMVVRVAAGYRAGRSGSSLRLGPPYEKSAWLDPAEPGVGVSTLARKIVACAGGLERGSAFDARAKGAPSSTERHEKG